MADESETQDAPSMENTIRATLQAINARNGTNYFVSAPQIANQPDYTLNDSGLSAFDNAIGAQTMNPRSVSQAFQPEPFQSLPGMLAGADSVSVGQLSRQALVNALMSYKTPPDPLDALRPYLGDGLSVPAPSEDMEGAANQFNSAGDPQFMSNASGQGQLLAKAPDPEQFRKNAEELMSAICRKKDESCTAFNKRLRDTCLQKFGVNPSSITMCRLLADSRSEPCIVSAGNDETDMCPQ